MTVREYKKDEHKSGFIGLRVVVKVGDDYRQKYFNFKKIKDKKDLDELIKQAKMLNAEWNMERNFIQSKKSRECKETRRSSSAYTTGISGIKMKYMSGSKAAKDKRKKRKYYYTAIFKISGSTNGVRFDKIFNINKLGYDIAWMNAVMYYAEQKSMSSFSHLLKRKPPIEQFIIIYKHQRSQGHDIPLTRLPVELDATLVN